jgi:futalosine hydrolase
MPHPLLVVTAVAAEAEAVRAGLTTAAETGPARPDDVVVEVVGVGPAAAAARTAKLLATRHFRGVISAGIAGGFPGRAPVGATVIGTRSIAADLGAENGDDAGHGTPANPPGFLSVDELGFGSSVVEADRELVKLLTGALPAAIAGDILTLSTVTGTITTAERLMARFPEAVAEAMEGYGVGIATAGIPFAELRTISNPIGPRDRESWRLKDAFAALSTASAALWTACG